jgi:hypothetical protein
MEMRRKALRPDAPAQLLGAAQTEPEMLGLVLADLLAVGGPKAASARACCRFCRAWAWPRPWAPLRRRRRRRCARACWPRWPC